MESDGNRCLDARIGVIALEREVLQLVLEDARGLAFDHQRRQRAGLPLQLLEDDVIGQMVLVQVFAEPKSKTNTLLIYLTGNYITKPLHDFLKCTIIKTLVHFNNNPKDPI